MKEIRGLLISLAAGLLGVITDVYMASFITNIQVPQFSFPNTVDISPSWHNPARLSMSPLWNNLLLLVGFGLQHSGMIRGPIKKVLKVFLLSEDACRVFFVLASSVYLMCMFYLWSPMPYPVWDIQHQELKIAVHVINFMCWLGAVVSMQTLDPLSLLGIRNYLDKCLKREPIKMTFVTTGLYGAVRHPTYSFLMLGYWITPMMSIGHLLFSTILSAYIVFAVAHFEEPDLVKSIGPDYVDYMKTTPRYIPNFTRLFTRTPSKKAD